jgi:hypothetical protein
MWTWFSNLVLVKDREYPGSSTQADRWLHSNTLFFCYTIFLVLFLLIPLRTQAQVQLKPFVYFTTQPNTTDQGEYMQVVGHIDPRNTNLEQINLDVLYDSEAMDILSIESKVDFGTVIANINNSAEEYIQFDVNITSLTVDSELFVITFAAKGSKKSFVRIGSDSTFISESNLIPFQSKDMTESHYTNSYRGIRILHGQTSFLSQTGQPVPIEIVIDSEREIKKAIIQYTPIPTGDRSADFHQVELTASSDPLIWTTTIPIEDVVTPGILYHFKIQTADGLLTLPQPITLENSFRMNIVTPEQFRDNTPPTLTYSLDSGVYEDAQILFIESDEPATIYCDLTGGIPSTASIVYTVSGISVDSTMDVSCFGVDVVENSSVVSTRNYVFNANEMVISLLADKLVIPEATNVELTWSVINGDTADMSELGSVPLDGSQIVLVDETTTYTLTGYQDDIIKTAEITIELIPNQIEAISLDLKATRTSVLYGESSTLMWETVGLLGTSITPQVGIVEANGTSEVSPIVTTVYTLTGSARGRSYSDTVTVVVEQRPAPQLVQANLVTTTPDKQRPSQPIVNTVVIPPTNTNTGPLSLFGIILGTMISMIIFFIFPS